MSNSNQEGGIFGSIFGNQEISVGLPVQDPIFGTTGYMVGPPINLTPRNPYANIAPMGSDRQIVQLFKTLADIKEKHDRCVCGDENEYTIPSENFLFDTPKESCANEPIRNPNPCNLPVNQAPARTCKPVDPCEQPAEIVNTQATSTSPGWSVIRNDRRYLLSINQAGTQKYYSGAGIMLFERNYISGSRNGPAVILFRSSLTHEYEELGGGVEPADSAGANTLVKTARREAFEESCKVFNLDKVDFGTQTQNLDREVGGDAYRCFFISLDDNQGNNGWKQIYINNKAKMVNASAPYKETDDMQRFFVSDISTSLASGPRGSMRCPDADRKMQTIAGRTKACLRIIIESYYSAITANPHKTTPVRNDDDTLSLVVN